MANHGKNAKIYWNGMRGDRFLNNMDTAATIDTAETTVFDSSGRKSFIPGNIDASISAQGLFQGATSESDYFFNNLIAATTPAVVNIFPNNDTLGNFGFGQQVDLTSKSLEMPVDGVVSLSVDAQTAGRMSVESLRALGAANSTGTLSATTLAGTADDNTSGTTQGGIGWMQRTDFLTADVAVTIQDSCNNSTWNTLLSFTSGTSRSGQRAVASNSSIRRYTRSNIVIDGNTSQTAQVFVGFTRN